ncbi:fructose-specific PTS transporter subunit EIIC [Eubacterium oxidoreducens]|uniref:PTS system, fructose subfamily, IIC component n=1 Tax=Eubacterium oxidoreducens TaxID=1732 RepID=A0A1G6AU94_EUBOX|nr:fructose-specific PTS transporter subunit EIIC [Eubacterium oxidoreducens]SDB11938.1 PTS system, fructose subfamily, IIC component [Eubacterium oxidoreducens]
MKDYKFNSKFIIIICIIICSFVVSSLFFAAINVTTLRSYEYDNLNYAVHAFSTRLNADITSENFTIDSDLAYWQCDSDGNILSTNSDDDYKTIQSYSRFSDCEDLLTPPTNSVCYKELYTQNNPFYTDGRACISSYLDDGTILLLETDGANMRSYEYRQLTLIISVELILLFIVIILITNNFFSYRGILLKMATFDELTGLSNRRSFTEDFKRLALLCPTDVCLFLLDVDYFKQINDKYSHTVGDEALQIVSEHIKELISKHGYSAARWGGDEFIGILKLPADKAYPLLEQLCQDIHHTDTPEGYHITVSIGLTPLDYAQPLKTISEMADFALYRSKQLGRNRVTMFTEDLADKVIDGPDKKSAFETDFVRLQETKSLEAPKQLTQNEKIFTYKSICESIIYAITWMIPFIAAGGILIGLAYLFDSASVDLSSLTIDARSELGTITPVASGLNTLGETCFNFMLPIFAAFMSFKLLGREAFMAGFVGGCMAIDTNSGFIGAMCAALVACYITHHLKQFTGHLPNYMRSAAMIIIYPIMTLLLMFLFSRFLLTPATSAIHSYLTSLLDYLASYNEVISGTFASTLMAIDMGGLLNKAAYNYATASLSSGTSGIMAAVMLGGMVPPIGISISMLLFKNKYTNDQKGQLSGVFFMGLSFITESVLPFVLTDIRKVILSCMAGAATAGFCSSLFGCTIPAPHGGIFVFILSNHPLLYILALTIGSFVTALILGRWKKQVKENLPR